MKIRLSRILVLCLAAVMVFALAACSSDPAASPSDSSDPQVSPTDSSPEASPSEDAPDASPSGDAGDGDITGKFATMEDFVKSDIVQAQLESMKESMDTDDMTMEILGEGNKLIYAYTFKEAQDADVMGPALSAGLETQAATFENIASTMATVVEVENPVVVVRYLNSDGSELCSQEFSAK